MAVYQNRFPWANDDLLYETYLFSIVQSITSLRQSCVFSKNDEHDISIVPCCTGEPICNDNGVDTENPFCFFYVATFTKIGLQLLLDNFEKHVLTLLNISPA